jgi:ATP-binding cassette subfamily B multidrug efflux pump
LDVFLSLKAYYWAYRYTGLTSLALVVLTTALALVRPRLLSVIIDSVLIEGRYERLPALAFWVFGAAVLQGACHYGRTYLGHVFGANVVSELRNGLYKRLQSLSFSYFDTARTGDLMARLTGDVEVFRQFLAFGMAGLLEFILMVSLGLIMMAGLDWRLTLVSIIFMPFLAALTIRFHHVIHPAFTHLREAMSDMSTAVQESITGIRTVKSFAREPQQIALLRERIETFVARHMGMTVIWSRFFPVMELLGHLSVVVLLLYGGMQAISGRISVGTLVAFFQLIWMIIGPVRQLGYQINNYTQSLAAGERLLEVLTTPRTVRNRPHAAPLDSMQGHVVFENVSFAYDKKHLVLEDVSLDVKPGMTVGIIGATGSGKSTLVSLIGRYYDVTKGRVLIDGRDVRDITLESLRRQIGIVFQDTFLFSTTIRENIAFARREATDAEIEAAARLADAHDFIMETKDGYQTLVGERGLGLSGGQKQRLAIARAVLAQPRILILDDATASVDMETEYAIQEALRAMPQQCTKFIIAHRISSVKDADLIIVLDHGRIVEQGKHERLLALNGVYRSIYDVQYQDDPTKSVTATPAVSDPAM